METYLSGTCVVMYENINETFDPEKEAEEKEEEEPLQWNCERACPRL